VLLLYALAKNSVHLITMAVSIRTANAIAICFSKKIMHLIFIAVSIRTANATAICFSKKLSAFNFHSCFYKDSKCYCYML
jgi:hypothetical protein